jgi:hypothetical protein
MYSSEEKTIGFIRKAAARQKNLKVVRLEGFSTLVRSK